MARFKRPRGRWATFVWTAAGLVVLVFAAFVGVEWLWFRDASEGVVSLLHAIRGLAAAVVAVAYGTWFVRARSGALERQEGQFLRFLNGLPVAVFALDSEGRPAFANERAKSMLGRGIVPRVGPKDLSTVYPSFVAGTDDRYPPERMPIVRALSEKVTSIVSDVELDRDGARMPIEAWGSPILDERGDVSYSIAVFFDISERRRLDGERVARVRAEERAMQAERFSEMQRDFINHAAHQLYTPLTPLKLHIAALRSGSDRWHLDALSDSVDRMQQLISEALRVVKLQSASIQVDTGTVELPALVQKAVERTEGAAKRRQVMVQADVEAGSVAGDEEMLLDVLVNVLGNAIKFSKPGGDVRVRGSVSSEVTVVIEDDGEGWDPKDAEILFKAFAQAPQHSDMVGHGWGLGLFVARALVDAHGGTIEGHSDGVGKGARFTIVLPKKRPVAAAGPPILPATP